MDEFAFLYLAAMVALVALVLWGMKRAQKAVLTTLAQTLYGEQNPGKYLALLKSRRLGFVLRKSTLALLRLEGHIQAGDAASVAADGAALDAMRLRPEERLEYEQKSMSFLLARGDYEGARACLAKLEKLLEREPDEKLREILADARLLIGIYADRDVTLIPVLEEQAAVQKDNQRGVTCYRLAKLCHFDGADGRAEDWLRQGLPLLRGTPWEPVMTAALGDRRVLDER